MTFIEPSDKEIFIKWEDRKFIFEQFQKLYTDDTHHKVYEVLGIEPSATITYERRGKILSHSHSDPKFEWYFLDTHCFCFGIEHGDDALLLLAGMIELGYFNTETGEVNLIEA